MIATPRLTLVPLTLDHLRQWQADRNAMETSLGLEPYPKTMPEIIQKEIEDAIPYWVEQVSKHPDHYPWFTNWEIIHREDKRSIGGIGLGGLPDASGDTLVGYYVDAHYHNQGYATESLQFLADWAFGHPQLKRMLAETPKGNLASQRVLSKNNFIRWKEKPKTYLWVKPRAGEVSIV